jgi:enoyl-[acyl-carrier protein] reductase / trans-2-enoyl-CoA reductase (NAD+)
MKDEVIAAIKADLGQIDCIVYSLASPRRTDPTDGETYKSVLKPIGAPYTQKNINTDTGEVNTVSIEPASDDEIAHTVKVMGGEDWELWIKALAEAGVLADGFQTVAYSYIGPDLTYPIYTNGTIGRAKEHLEESAARMNAQFGDATAYVSVNKALVTQASSAIPVVPLYISLLYKVMKEKGPPRRHHRADRAPLHRPPRLGRHPRRRRTRPHPHRRLGNERAGPNRRRRGLGKSHDGEPFGAF